MTSYPKLVLQPLVHVTDLPATVAMFEALGAELVQGSRDGDWTPSTTDCSTQPGTNEQSQQRQ